MSSQDIPAELAPPDLSKPPRIWKFWGTSLWGLFAFAALFLGQVTVVLYLVLMKDAPFDLTLLTRTLSSGTAIALSVIMGLPAVCAALWLATRLARMRFAAYLALDGTSWKNFAVGALGLILLVGLWELISRAMGRDSSPGFMMDVLKSARADGALWLLVLAFCVAAPMTEEFFVRGFLYRGWSESFLRPWGAIALSSLVWTAMHLQYDWFFFCEIFTIGLWLGWLRYRYNSTWLTVFVHGLNNLAATVQTLWIATYS
ncbi:MULTISPECIES: CPBP family intramembrane glutamic endopeptidase [unclassified Tardiphaga]|uniref:CPBP family intramembrane glutamic endopeptidase n=1 Tax=unclassified Tardiphaga TaxID=2631404 RepID=UPI001164DA50|nr:MULTISPECIES: type II CAAX endopeptidase family protein [unclassified Tardiphaga]QDM17473.1 CPBP family intramembrane metalloprotease [Tardiphaga sp. vice278]QDM22441.1 CPBP family intramembrane metalloprotease [Tardiphaga sp. vice154]